MSTLAIPSTVVAYAQTTAQKLARTYNRSPDDVPDITQEILYQMIRAMKNFRGESAETTYLNGITNRFAKNFCRHAKKEAEWVKGFESVDEETLGYAASLGEHVSRRDDTRLAKACVRHALRALKKPAHSIALLFLCGYNRSEIADLLEIKRNTFYRRAWPAFCAAIRKSLKKFVPLIRQITTNLNEPPPYRAGKRRNKKGRTQWRGRPIF